MQLLNLQLIKMVKKKQTRNQLEKSRDANYKENVEKIKVNFKKTKNKKERGK